MGAPREIDDAERRARLGQRHRLAGDHRAGTPVEVARSLTAIHGTDPGSTVLGILARTRNTTIADIDRAMYDDRSLVRLLGLRRTVFAVASELAPVFWAASANVVRDQVRLLHRMLAASGIADIDSWVTEAEARLLVELDARFGATSTELAAADPYLGHRVSIGGPDDATQSVTSRLLIHMSADGRIIRARPKGGWTSTQSTWVTRTRWRTDWPNENPPIDSADEAIARSWLFGHGPASIEDFTWWTGWPKGRASRAIQRAGGVEVALSTGSGFLLAEDLDEVVATDEWVALLPGLDSTTMGWKARDFYLGPHGARLFDNVGNGGPTVWVDGRIVGGWTQLDSGPVVFELFEDVGRERTIQLEATAADLERTIGAVRLKPRARRWTVSERSLREMHP